MDPQRNIQQLSSSKSDRKKIQNRKKNVIKKAEELSKLCGVDVCLILYQRQSNIAETWPQDPEHVKRSIAAYKANPAIRYARIPASDETKGLKVSRARKSDGGHENVVSSDEKISLEREMVYPTWDDRLDYCSEEELIRLVASMDAKLEASTKRIDSLSIKSSKTSALDHHSNLNFVPRSSRNYIPTM